MDDYQLDQIEACMRELRNKGWATEHIELIRQGIYDYYSGQWDFTDNLRYARSWNIEETKLYAKQLKGGCCGFYDEYIPCDEGLVMIGFNYGH